MKLIIPNKEYTKKDPLILDKYKVCVVGVFSNGYSTSLFFSKYLEKKNYIDKVFNYDYRENIKKIKKLSSDLTEISKNYDIVIIFKGSGIPIETIKNMSKNCIILLWFMDWYINLFKENTVLEFSKYVQYRTITGYGSGVKWVKNIDLPVYHVLDGIDPDLYFPEKIEKKYDITFIGSRENERDSIYKLLKNSNYNVEFFGPRYTKFIYPDEFRNICNSSKIVLNISRGNIEGYSSLRLWYLLSSSACVLSKKIPGIESHLKLRSGYHLLEFENEAQLILSINKLLKNPDYRKFLSNNANEFVSKYRTWDNVIENLFYIIRNEKMSSCEIKEEKIYNFTRPNKPINKKTSIRKYHHYNDKKIHNDRIKISR